MARDNGRRARPARESLALLASAFDRTAQLHLRTAAILANSAIAAVNKRPLITDLTTHAEALAQLARQLREAAAAAQSHGNGLRPLTRRELQVLCLMAHEGLTNRQIGDRLGIVQRTAQSHVENIYAKLGVHNRAQATAWYFKQHAPYPSTQHDTQV